MSNGNNAGNIIAGVFLILFGLCITLLGGGCTILMMSEMGTVMTSSELPFLLVSLVILGGGLALLWVGFKLVTGGFQR
ncbi:MAG TPA: hypothetical protein VGX37_00810 [Allosphingosinicella sp.]|jgi:hypothetical protein|nr:hypothetical protein [Allosphingosinicella sp.]